MSRHPTTRRWARQRAHERAVAGFGRRVAHLTTSHLTTSHLTTSHLATSRLSAVRRPAPRSLPCRIVRVAAQIATVLLILSVPSATFADAGDTGYMAANSLPTVIGNLRRWVMAILFAIATLFLVLAGVYWAIAGGDPAQVDKTKAALKNALMGYGLAVLAPVLLQAVKGTPPTSTPPCCPPPNAKKPRPPPGCCSAPPTSARRGPSASATSDVHDARQRALNRTSPGPLQPAVAGPPATPDGHAH